jgi:hypothetical protein
MNLFSMQKEDDHADHPLFRSRKSLKLPSSLQLILQDHGQHDAYDTHHYPTEKGIPPDGVIDDQTKLERLANDTCQPE